MLDHRSVIPYTASLRLRRLESVAFVIVALVGILAAVRRRDQGGETASERVAASSELSVSGGRRVSDGLSRGLSRLARSGLVAPLLLCSAASVSLMLHLPDARYWISCVPLLYIALAFGWDQAMRVDRARVPLTVAASLIILLCLSPFPVSAHGNGTIIRHLRQKWDFYESPKVAGSPPLAFYAYGTVVQPVALSDLTPEAIAARSIDMVVVDASLRQSATWQGAEGFWTGFEEDPERFGYAQAATQSGGDFISVYARIPFELMQRPASQPGPVPPLP